VTVIPPVLRTHTHSSAFAHM